MARCCELTGKKVSFGRNVSHSNRKTNRPFKPNIQTVTVASEALGRTLRLDLATSTLRSVQKRGGLDAFLLGARDAQLTPQGLRLKRQVQRTLTSGRGPRAAASELQRA